MDIPMAGIRSTRPRRWVGYIPTDLIDIVADTSTGEGLVQAKIHKALILQKKLDDEFLRVSEHLRNYEVHYQV